MNLLTVADYEQRAKETLSDFAWEYYSYGKERGLCLRDSTDAFSRYRVRSRLLRDVSNRSLATTVLGQTVPFPIGVASTAAHVLCHQEAEKETARGAAAAGALMILSSDANMSIADVAAAAPRGLRWMQVYPFNDRLLTQHMIREAERNGYKAIVVTIDSPSAGVMNIPIQQHFYQIVEDLKKEGKKFWFPNFDADIPSCRTFKDKGDETFYGYMFEMQFNSTATWEYIKWIKSITSLPVACKGILTAEAAKAAVDAGVDGIVVSAHGGRQMDGAPAPIDALAEVVQAVQGRGVEVFMDGGVRTGTDVFKALGRGARMVFVGRPIIWGLACQGADGVKNVLDILKNELDSAVATSGCTSPSDIPRGAVVHESYYHREPFHSNL